MLSDTEVLSYLGRWINSGFTEACMHPEVYQAFVSRFGETGYGCVLIDLHGTPFTVYTYSTVAV